MQIKPPGLFTRGKLVLGQPAPHITPDSLAQELSQSWAPRGFEVYKTALIGLDVVLKKSGWTGVGMKIKQDQGSTVIVYNAFAPSAMVRVMAMGLIPILIVNSTSWKPLLRTFEQYVQSSAFFGGGQAQLPQATAHYAQGASAQAYAQQQYAQQQPQQYPCGQCGTSLAWVAQHQRWYCGQCQQYR